jgi:hypothetical protein
MDIEEEGMNIREEENEYVEETRKNKIFIKGISRDFF